MTAASLLLEDVSWAPRRRHPLILKATTFELAAGGTLGIVGPNGAGKSTLLRLIYRYHTPLTGRVCVDGEDIWHMPARAAARKVAAVLQEQPTDFALTVREIVSLGRTPHRLGFTSSGARDADIIEEALARLDLEGFEHRRFGTLSGGERQRVMVARALAQEPQLIVLDEPTNHLDIRHQLEVLSLIGSLDVTIVTSLHDLNTAADICDSILLLKDGVPEAFGSPDAVLSDHAVSDAFRVRARREHLSVSDTTHFTYVLPD